MKHSVDDIMWSFMHVVWCEVPGKKKKNRKGTETKSMSEMSSEGTSSSLSSSSSSSAAAAASTDGCGELMKSASYDSGHHESSSSSSSDVTSSMNTSTEIDPALSCSTVISDVNTTPAAAAVDNRNNNATGKSCYSRPLKNIIFFVAIVFL